MIKLKNIAKIVFVALFVCVYSFETGAQLDPVYAAVEGLKDVPENRLYDALMTAMKSNLPVERHLEFMTKVSQTYPEKLAKLPQEQNKNLVAVTTGTNPMLLLGYKTPEEKAAEEKEKPMGLEIIAATQGVFLDLGKGSTSGTQGGSTNPGKGPSLQTSAGTNTQQDVSICSGKTGVFEDLVKAGVKIFNRLRDLIYVVAGFGIIAIAVGGFFGSLNWKWLGAIVIALLVIASAGDLLKLIAGCEDDPNAHMLVSNTLSPRTLQVANDN